jgi:CubicO group peptidase (beta-lactamase class C family)
MRKIFFLLVLNSISAITIGQINEQAAIDSIFAEWNKTDAPGCAVGIVENGELIFAKGYGIADLEHDIPITPGSVFYIGSVSKQFVTFCLLLLEEQGKIDLDDKIQEYLPDFPEYQSPLTIRHFIHHTSGVRDFFELLFLKGADYLDNLDVDVVYDLLKRQEELNFEPGELYMYSNSCYFMLAMIIEKASGESLRSFADKNIFQPLGMESTLFYDDNTDLIRNRVFSYEKSQDENGFNNLIMRFDLVGSGGVYSTIEDLFLWDQNFYHNTLGKGGQEIIQKMHKEGLLNNGESSGYAFALNNGTYSGLKTVSHAGSLAGYRAQLMRFPDQKFSVIILANRGDFNPTALSFRVADVFLQDQYVSEPEEESEKEAEAEPREASKRFELQHMTGRYEIAPGVIAEISIKDDSLHVLQLWNQSEYNLSRSGNNIFVIPGAGNIQFIFSELNDGHAQILTVFQNGNTTPAKRMPDTDLSGLNLSEYQGEYYSREIDATYHIFIEGDRLRMKIPNNPARDLDPVSMDEFSSERMQLKFNRSDNLVASFEVNVGRVENLKFDKK